MRPKTQEKKNEIYVFNLKTSLCVTFRLEVLFAARKAIFAAENVGRMAAFLFARKHLVMCKILSRLPYTALTRIFFLNNARGVVEPGCFTSAAFVANYDPLLPFHVWNLIRERQLFFRNRYSTTK